MQKKKGFTLIELLVVIAIIAILAAILFPVFARARENARRASCQSNLKQLALGVFQYTQDFDEKYPLLWANRDATTGTYGVPTIATAATADQGWVTILQPYLKSDQLFQCPSETAPPGVDSSVGGAASTDYWFNRLLANTSQAAVEAVALTVMNGDGSSNHGAYFYDGQTENSTAGTAPAATDPITGLTGGAHGRHLDGGNFAFADGHVKWLKGNAISPSTTINGSAAVLPYTALASAGKPYFGTN
jgi:prepilin-type N-terminal cleavage/methylation domain-containing protein/prepilin-type processing-associated H-X9-DG protein